MRSIVMDVRAHFSLLVSLSLFVATFGAKKPHSVYKDYNLRPLTSSAEILRARGFIADEHFFKTSEGYVLCIIRGRNPLFEARRRRKKKPILFVHGLQSSSAIWLVNSLDAKPEDLTKVIKGKFSKLSLNELVDSVGHSDSARSLPFIALNFGHEVWLMNRRGSLKSERKAGHLDRSWWQIFASLPRIFFGGGFTPTAGLLPKNLAKQQVPTNVTITQIVKTKKPEVRRRLMKDLWIRFFTDLNPFKGALKNPLNFKDLEMRIVHSFDPDYWNYSFDEQAENDFPQVLDFVLEKSGHNKVHVVTNSAGSPIVLMSLSLYPSMSNKIAKMIHWCPCLNSGTKSDVFELLNDIVYPLQSYIGPVPMAYMTPQTESMIQSICSNEFRQRTICAWFMDVVFGQSRGQSPVTRFLAAATAQPTSSRELQHLLQMSREIVPRRFNYNTEEANIQKYGQSIPPQYDFGQIKVRDMVFYTGLHDTISSPDMVKFTVSQLKVPYKFVLINETGIWFNHGSPFLHDQTARLIILPSLMDLELDEELRQLKSQSKLD